MRRPSVAFYIGGFEPIGGIESCFEDLMHAFAGADIARSMFVWADDLPQLRAIAASGTRVHRSPLRRGCRWGLPDWALLLRHGARLREVDRIVFGKIPPEPVFRRLLAILDRRPGGRPELLFVTPYRPAELWGTIPGYIGSAIDTMIVQSPDFTWDLRAMGFAGRVVELPYLPPSPASASDAVRPRDDVCRLGFLGRFAPQKNLLYLLDIVAALQDEPVELHLFGEGDLEPQVRAEVAARSLPVTFHGPVARAQVPAAIDSCDIFLNPSISEGQCLVALEVLSRGRPFLASAVGAIPQILGRGHFGEIVPLNDAVAAAARVRETIMAWRSGAWSADAILADYRLAYDASAIATRYLDLLTSPARKADAA